MTTDLKRVLMGLAVLLLVTISILLAVKVHKLENIERAQNQALEEKTKRVRQLEFQMKMACYRGLRMTRVITKLVDAGELPELAFRVNAGNSGWQVFCEPVEEPE